MIKYTIYIGQETSKRQYENRAGELVNETFEDAYVDKHLDHCLAQVGQTGATITRGYGYWNGKRERTTIVEIIGTNSDKYMVRDRVFTIAKMMKEYLMQDAVMVTSEEVSVETV